MIYTGTGWLTRRMPLSALTAETRAHPEAVGRRIRASWADELKLLIDMNLSPQWLEALADAGIEARHWSEERGR